MISFAGYYEGDLPFFTVVIPLYNMAAYIERAIASVLAQSWPDFELIVVDDGSSDGGGDLARQCADPRLRVIRQANAGAAAARNSGIRQATTDYVTFLDADDSYDPHFLATIHRLVRRYPQAGLYVASYRIEGERHSARAEPRHPELPAEGVIADFPGLIDRHLFLGLISSSSCLARRVVERAGYFQEGVHFAEDSLYWLHLSLHYPVAFTAAVAATVRSQTGSGGDLTNERRCYSSTAHFEASHPCRALLGDLRSLDLTPQTAAALRRIIALTFADIAVLHYHHGLDEIGLGVLDYAAAQDTAVAPHLLHDRAVAFCDQLIVHGKTAALQQMLATPFLGQYPDLRLFYRLYLAAPSRRWLTVRHWLRRLATFPRRP